MKIFGFHEKPKVGRKNLTVKVRFLDHSTVVRKLRAPAGKLLTDKGVDQVLEQLAGQIESEFPKQEFRLVPLRDGNFNFVEVAVDSAEESVPTSPGLVKEEKAVATADVPGVCLPVEPHSSPAQGCPSA